MQDELPSPIRLCEVCGGRGPLSCGKCKAVSYCGAAHQRIDWSLGDHKNQCGKSTHSAIEKNHNLFDEYELVMEPEKLPASQANGETAEEADTRRMKDYEEYLENKAEDEELKDVTDDEFNKYAGDIDEDVIFGKFKKRVNFDKKQVCFFGKNSVRCLFQD